MSVRAKFLGFVDVIMRIPPLFLLDEILKMNLFESSSQNLNNLVAELNDTINATSNVTEAASSSLDFYGLSLTLLKCLVFLTGKCGSMRTKSFCVKCFFSSKLFCLLLDISSFKKMGH